MCSLVLGCGEFCLVMVICCGFWVWLVCCWLCLSGGWMRLMLLLLRCSRCWLYWVGCWMLILVFLRG